MVKAVIKSWSVVNLKAIKEIVITSSLIDPFSYVEHVLVALFPVHLLGVVEGTRSFDPVILWEHGQSDTVEACVGEAIEHFCDSDPVTCVVGHVEPGLTLLIRQVAWEARSQVRKEVLDRAVVPGQGP